jgi:putative phosphoesterase
MVKIVILSDTHSHLDEKAWKYFENCDEIWHAGDIGNVAITDALKAIKPTRAVFGNIDGNELRKEFTENLIFEIEGIKVFITHIGGYPEK